MSHFCLRPPSLASAPNPHLRSSSAGAGVDVEVPGMLVGVKGTARLGRNRGSPTMLSTFLGSPRDDAEAPPRALACHRYCARRTGREMRSRQKATGYQPPAVVLRG